MATATATTDRARDIEIPLATNYCMAPPTSDPSAAPDPATVEQMIRHGATSLEAAGVWFGHGTDNAIDEAAELVFFAAGLRHEDADRVYGSRLTEQQRAAAMSLLERRIRERVPAAYLTHRMWFAGREYYVDERVLVPRSPIAELIEAHFEPWIDASRVRRILDIGTGSGCIAIACAHEFPEARVDATDISPGALEVATSNMERHGVGSRMRVLRSDVFSALAGERYDIIVSNPPYVGALEYSELPEEYLREPASGLASGTDGLDVARRILAEAHRHLEPHGVLIVEVGNSEDALVAAFPELPFLWLEFARGGGGVFLLTAAQLQGRV
jgi:ribosomal protein L3 glutamine methyltransferase